MDTYKDIAQLFTDKNVVSAKFLEENGITRNLISKYLYDNVLEKAGYGKYCLKDSLADEFYLIQIRSQKIVFSHASALYLLKMSDKIPISYDVTVPQGYNVTKIKRDFSNINFHYSKVEMWSLGLETATTPFGYKINVYDKERSVLDIIKNRKNIDTQIYIQAIKEYFKGKVNLRKLLKYSKQMNLEQKIREYIEIM